MKICLDDILFEVSNYYGYPCKKILAKNRNKTTIKTRQIAVYLAKQFTDHSLNEIAEFFKYKDHHSVVDCVRAVTKKLEVGEGDIVYDHHVMTHNLKTKE